MMSLYPLIKKRLFGVARVAVKVIGFVLSCVFFPFTWLLSFLVDKVKETHRRYKRYYPTLWYFAKPFTLSLGGFGFCLWVFVRFNMWRFFVAPNIIEGIFVLVLLISFMIFIVCSKRFFMPFWYIHKVFEHEREIGKKGRVILYDGAPESGKSLSLTYDMFYLASFSWADMLFNYLHTFTAISHRKAEFDSLEEFWQYEVRSETVNYYLKNPDKIPLLVSNYAIKSGNRFSSVLDMRAFLQYTRLPECGVIAMDEYADKLSNQRSNMSLLSKDPELLDENLKLSETFSKERHYGDWYIGGAEQENGEGFIGLRRVVSINRYLLGCVKVCQADSLIRKKMRIRAKVLKRFDKGYAKEVCFKKRWLKKITRLNCKIGRIGFFMIDFADTGVSTRSKRIVNAGYYCLPINLPFKYATRSYQFEYDGYKHDLDLETFTSLYKPSRPDPEPLAPDISEDLGYLEIKREKAYWDMVKTSRANKMQRRDNPEDYKRYLEY